MVAVVAVHAVVGDCSVDSCCSGALSSSLFSLSIIELCVDDGDGDESRSQDRVRDFALLPLLTGVRCTVYMPSMWTGV